MAVESLRMKRNWTHGEILFDFAVRRNREWTASVQYESNYILPCQIRIFRTKIEICPQLAHIVRLK
jgi:hypothetical protein